MSARFAFAAALAIVATPIAVSAQTVGSYRPVYVSDPAALPWRGGRAGITFALDTYQANGVQYVKVLAVDPASPFRALSPGDFIFAIDGVYFRSGEEFGRLITALAPGTPATLWYLDANNGFAVYTDTEKLLGEAAPTDKYIVSSQPPVAVQPPPASSANQNAQLALDRSLDAIAQRDATGWWQNRYDIGSMHGSFVRSASADGSYIARGYYTFNGGKNGWIDATIAGGELKCVEYWDTWFGCRGSYGGTRSASSDAAKAAAVAIAVAALVAIARSGPSHSSGSSTSYTPPDDSDAYYRRPASTQSQHHGSHTDTSVGCAWGDRKYGTCH
jgi:hypothetical protein